MTYSQAFTRGSARLAAAALCVWPGAAAAEQLTWDGSCGGSNWHTICGPGSSMTNWMPEFMPGSADPVSIPRGAPIVVIQGGLGDALRISCSSGLSITNGGTLRLANGRSSISNLAVNNSLLDLVSPDAVLELSGNCSLNGATLVGQGELFNTGAVSGLSLGLIGSSGYTNGSGATTTIGQFIVPALASVTNEGGATLTMTLGTGSPGLTSSGLFTNNGTFITQHNGTPASAFVIQPFMQQDGGTFIVRGISSVSGTQIVGACDFNDGSILVEDNANLRFTSAGPMLMDGLLSISGPGNAFVQTGAQAGSDWQVLGPLTVNLSGSGGFVLNGSRMTLSDILTNSGRMLWSSNRMQKSACDDCTARFVNTSAEAFINTGSSSNTVVLDVQFINSGTITHQLGNLALDLNGKFTNTAVYALISGDIRPTVPTVAALLVNEGMFIKPDEPGTGPSLITTRFGSEPSGIVRVEKSELAFGGGSGSASIGLDMSQSLLIVDEDATLRLTNGTHLGNSGDSIITGGGGVVIQGIGGTGSLVAREGASVTLDVDGPAPGGAFLFSGGRLGGPGSIINIGDLTWFGGGIGALEPPNPTLTADVINRGHTFLNGGLMTGTAGQPPVRFTNDASGVVTQSPFTLNMINAMISNHGQWTCMPATPVTLQGAPANASFVNEPDGVFTVESTVPQATVTINVSLTNLGTVRVKAPCVLALNSLKGLSGSALLEGAWIVDLGATITFPGATTVTELGPGCSMEGNGASCPDVDPRTNHGTLTTNGNWGSLTSMLNGGLLNCGDGTTFTSNGDMVNDGGAITLGAGSTMHCDDCVSTAGSVQLDEGATLDCDDLSSVASAFNLAIGASVLCTNCTIDGGTLSNMGGSVQSRGDINNEVRDSGLSVSICEEDAVFSIAGGAPSQGGFFCETFNNGTGGVLRPGGPLAPGPFHITGDFHQFTGGHIQIELAGATPVALHDQVIINGNAALGGGVEVSFLEPFTPTVGQQFTILTTSGGTVSGQFNQVTGPGQFSLSYSPTSVVLTFNGPAVPGDLTGDGVVNSIDLGILLSAWSIPPTAPACGGAPGPCPADINDDGFVNTLDLGVLLSAWTL